MRRIFMQGLVAACLVAATGGALADGHHEDPVWLANATALAHLWYSNYNSGDIDANLAFYADDIVVRNPDGSIGVGADASREQQEGWREAGLVFRGAPVAPTASGFIGGDGAWALFSYEILLDGDVVTTGDAMWTYEKVDGGWLAVSVTNIDTTPAQAQE